MRTLIIFCLALFVCVYYSTTEYFIASPMLASKYILQTGHLPSRLFENSNTFWKNHANTYTQYSGSSILIATLNMISGIDVYLFKYLPVTLIPLLVIVRQTFLLPVEKNRQNRNLSLAFFALYIIYLIVPSSYAWRLTYQPLGFISHVAILYITLKVFMVKNNSFKRSDFIVILLLYSLSLLNYYSMSTINITFMFFLSLFCLIVKRKWESPTRTFLNLGIIFFISYFMFDIMWYTVLSNIKGEAFEIPSIIINSFLRYATGHTPSEELYAYGLPFTVAIEDRILSIIFHSFIGFGPIILSIMLLLINHFKLDRGAYGLILIFASMLTAGWESIPYGMAFGIANLRYLMRFTPLVTLFVLLWSFHKPTHKHKTILYFFMLWLFISTIYQIKVPLIRDRVYGMSSLKLELVDYPEYTTLATYLGEHAFANFQVSGEIWLSSIRIGSSSKISISPIHKNAYTLREFFVSQDLDIIKNSFNLPAVIILTKTDFSKPMWGEFHGYVIEPIGNQGASLLVNLSSLIYNSMRVNAFMFN